MNCDPIARWYRWLEYGAFGRELEKCRNRFLDTLDMPRRVLMAGEGDGRFLQAFNRRYPGSRVDYFDASAQMLRLARRRTAASVVRFHEADVRTVNFEIGTYDLIVTHFFLDCFSPGETEALVRRFSAAATCDARWLVSEFQCPRPWARYAVKGLYAFFRFTTGLTANQLPDFAPELVRQGFRLDRNRRSLSGLLSSELWRR